MRVIMKKINFIYVIICLAQLIQSSHVYSMDSTISNTHSESPQFLPRQVTDQFRKKWYLRKLTDDEQALLPQEIATTDIDILHPMVVARNNNRHTAIATAFGLCILDRLEKNSIWVKGPMVPFANSEYIHHMYFIEENNGVYLYLLIDNSRIKKIDLSNFNNPETNNLFKTETVSSFALTQDKFIFFSNNLLNYFDNEKSITSFEGLGGHLPTNAVSPDGSFAVFAYQKDLYILKDPASKIKQMKAGKKFDESWNNSVPTWEKIEFNPFSNKNEWIITALKFAPDNQSLLAGVSTNGCNSNNIIINKIVSIDCKKSTMINLPRQTIYNTEEPFSFNHERSVIEYGRWITSSPDSRYIAFIAHGIIHVYDTMKKKEISLTTEKSGYYGDGDYVEFFPFENALVLCCMDRRTNIKSAWTIITQPKSKKSFWERHKLLTKGLISGITVGISVGFTLYYRSSIWNTIKSFRNKIFNWKS